MRDAIANLPGSKIREVASSAMGRDDVLEASQDTAVVVVVVTVMVVVVMVVVGQRTPRINSITNWSRRSLWYPRLASGSRSWSSASSRSAASRE